MRVIQPFNIKLIKYTGLLWAKALLWDRVYDEDPLKSFFVKVLQESTRHGIRLFCSWNNHAAVQDLVRHAQSLAHL